MYDYSVSSVLFGSLITLWRAKERECVCVYARACLCVCVLGEGGYVCLCCCCFGEGGQDVVVFLFVVCL